MVQLESDSRCECDAAAVASAWSSPLPDTARQDVDAPAPDESEQPVLVGLRHAVLWLNDEPRRAAVGLGSLDAGLSRRACVLRRDHCKQKFFELYAFLVDGALYRFYVLHTLTAPSGV